MKILVCHNYYQSTSGEDLVIAKDIEILRGTNVEIVEYSRSNKEIETYGVTKKVAFFLNAMYSRRTVADVSALVRKERPDAALVQNVFPLISPSLYYVLHRLQVPIVQLVYNYRFLCANGVLFTQGRVCERCIKGSFLNAVLHRCYKRSWLLSGLYAATIALHRHLGGFGRMISAYVTPDLFLRAKLAEGGYQQDRMFPVLNPFDVFQYRPVFGHEGYFVYFGRIVREKGIFTLLEAMATSPECKLVVVGDGEAAEEAKALVAKRGLAGVSFAGPKYGADLIPILNGARAVIVPTEWYDNSPLVVHQSFALGKPVIASNIDGIPEIVKDGDTGLLFEPGNHQQLAEQMARLESDDSFREALGRNARRMAEHYFTAARRYQSLISVINYALNRC